jgi:hypothetical protein
MSPAPTDPRTTDFASMGPPLPSRLPGLLIALAVIGGLLGAAWFFQQETRHVRAAAKLSSLGARVEWEGGKGAGRSGGATSVDCRDLGDRITDADLAWIESLGRVETLDLSGCSGITDEGLKIVGRITTLKQLTLGSPDPMKNTLTTRITAEGVKHLAPLTQLTVLSLEGTRITDAGLVPLRGMKNLELLNLRGTAITDAGLAHLRGLSQLEELNLDGTKISDAGLRALMDLSRLRVLSVLKTQVSPEGLAALQKALPDAVIVSEKIGHQEPEGLDME